MLYTNKLTIKFTTKYCKIIKCTSLKIMAYKFEKPLMNLSMTSNTIWDAFDFGDCDISWSDDETPEINIVTDSLSFSNKLKADKGKVKFEDREYFGLDFSMDESEKDKSEDDHFFYSGSYNKYSFVWMGNSNEPLITIVEESWESEASL